MKVGRTIGARPATVWRQLEDIASHVDWMADAESIRFTSRRRSGVGTTFDCDTRVGPLKVTDRMEVVEWKPRRAMGVRHVGLVTGTGRFTLRRSGLRRTRLVWEERLRIPWWLGGPLASPVLRLIWRGNLKRFAAKVER